MSQFPEVGIGEPLRHEALTVFPLFSRSESHIDYLLSDEAISAGTVTVEEVGESGSVPNLLVTNRGDARVLFLEGEELRGAKQNRVLNTSVLIAAQGQTKIPVSCVEQGRWRYVSRHFAASDYQSSPKMRHILKKSVQEAAVAGRGHDADQRAVWQEVSRKMQALGAMSPTAAMADAYESKRSSLNEFRQRLNYVEGATGLAVVVGSRIAAIDLFDKPSTCRKAWDRLVSGYAIDALEAASGSESVGLVEVERLLTRLRATPWQQTPAVGEGQEYQADAGGETHASVLELDGTVVHGSAIVAAG